jgi:prolyl-tRNA synthetase
VNKCQNFSEWYHSILEEAEIIDVRYPIKGMHVWLPQGFKIRKNILRILRTILDEDHQEVLFPLLIPEDELEKEAIHVRGFEDEVYWITHGGLTELNKKLALRPTSETAMYPMFSLWVRSHSDLPMKFYQIVNTFRYETKHTRPLIRVREITTFKEAHTIHSSEEEAEEQVENAVKIYKRFFDALGIPYVITKRPQWDKFPGAKYTVAFDTIMPDGKTLQIGTVHNLGQTFARTFEIIYETPSGDQEYVYQTCYGLSDRIIASIIAVHGDEAGLRLTPEVAPYEIVIVPIIYKEVEEKVLNFCIELADSLEKANIRVHLDSRDIRAGKKFYEWEMRGIPVRLEIGPKDIDHKTLVISRRDKLQKETVNIKSIDLISHIKTVLEDVNQNMKASAWDSFKKHIRSAGTIDEAADQISKYRGIVSFAWCGDENCGKELEEKIRADILGIEKDEHGESCINCEHPAECKALISKTY